MKFFLFIVRSVLIAIVTNLTLTHVFHYSEADHDKVWTGVAAVVVVTVVISFLETRAKAAYIKHRDYEEQIAELMKVQDATHRPTTHAAYAERRRMAVDALRLEKESS